MGQRHRRGYGPFAAELRDEFRRCWSPPYEVPVVVVVNAGLVLLLWFLAPLRIFDLFFTLHGELALPMVLASWMYADVPATNVLGGDADHARTVLDDPAALRRYLDIKNAALWIFVSPLCVLSVAAVTASYLAGYDLPGNPPRSPGTALPLMVVTLVWILFAPLGALGVAGWVGVLFPYHPISLKERWEDRAPVRRKLVRWGVLVVLPYGLVPALMAVVIAPSALYWHLTAANGLSGQLSPFEFLVGTAITIGCSFALLGLGRKGSARLVARRRDALDAYLADPTLG